MLTDSNAIGDRGELIFAVTISRLHGSKPLFRPRLLGGKWPVADALVELQDEPGMFFLVQVKATTRGYTEENRRLLISTDRSKLQLLAGAPVPTFLVGVDIERERAYISAVQGAISRRWTSISTMHLLAAPDVRVRLYEEIKAFWSAVRDRNLWELSSFLEKGGDSTDEPK